MANNKQLASIFLIVFIDLLGFSLILPLLPYYAQTFGANPFMTGLLVAIYAAAQMISAPLWGRLSDRIGRRPVLLIAIGATTAGFLLLASAQSLLVLFLARLIDGLGGGSISVAQAYITDSTDTKNRARGLGLVGAAFGLGFIIGPAVGGLLSRWGYSVPALVAAGLAFINFILVLFWLPESLTRERRANMATSSRRAPFTIKALFEALQRPFVGPLLHTRFFYALAFATFQGVFSLYSLYRFGLTSQYIGYILAYVGVLSAVTQGVLVGQLVKRFSDRQLLFGGMIAMTVGMVGWAIAPNVPTLLLAMLPLAVAGGTLNTVLQAALSKTVAPMEVGGILGISASLESFTRVLAPTIGGLLIGQLGTYAPGIFGGLLLVYVSWYVYRNVFPKMYTSEGSQPLSIPVE